MNRALRHSVIASLLIVAGITSLLTHSIRQTSMLYDVYVAFVNERAEKVGVPAVELEVNDYDAAELPVFETLEVVDVTLEYDPRDGKTYIMHEEPFRDGWRADLPRDYDLITVNVTEPITPVFKVLPYVEMDYADLGLPISGYNGEAVDFNISDSKSRAIIEGRASSEFLYRYDDRLIVKVEAKVYTHDYDYGYTSGSYTSANYTITDIFIDGKAWSFDGFLDPDHLFSVETDGDNMTFRSAYLGADSVYNFVYYDEMLIYCEISQSLDNVQFQWYYYDGRIYYRSLNKLFASAQHYADAITESFTRGDDFFVEHGHAEISPEGEVTLISDERLTIQQWYLSDWFYFPGYRDYFGEPTIEGYMKALLKAGGDVEGVDPGFNYSH